MRAIDVRVGYSVDRSIGTTGDRSENIKEAI